MDRHSCRGLLFIVMSPPCCLDLAVFTVRLEEESGSTMRRGIRERTVWEAQATISGGT